MDPSLCFQTLKDNGIYNFLLTSGTISPFDHWQAELKLPFATVLKNQHVVNTKTNLLAGIVQKGPS